MLRRFCLKSLEFSNHKNKYEYNRLNEKKLFKLFILLKVEWTNWYRNQPDNAGNNEHHVHIGFRDTQQWNDLPENGYWNVKTVCVKPVKKNLGEKNRL